MKPSLRPWCRPGTPCVLGTGVLPHHRLPQRTLIRRRHRATNRTCFGRSLVAKHEIAAVQQCMPAVGGVAMPRTQELAGSVLLRNLEPGLAQLPVKQREVLVLVWLEEMTYEQTADLLGISVRTVRSRLNLALEQLHRWLASVNEAPLPSVH